MPKYLIPILFCLLSACQPTKPLATTPASISPAEDASIASISTQILPQPISAALNAESNEGFIQSVEYLPHRANRGQVQVEVCTSFYLETPYGRNLAKIGSTDLPFAYKEMETDSNCQWLIFYAPNPLPRGDFSLQVDLYESAPPSILDLGCAYYFEQVQGVLDEQGSGIQVGCAVSDGTLLISAITFPETLSQIAADEAIQQALQLARNESYPKKNWQEHFPAEKIIQQTPKIVLLDSPIDQQPLDFQLEVGQPILTREGLVQVEACFTAPDQQMWEISDVVFLQGLMEYSAEPLHFRPELNSAGRICNQYQISESVLPKLDNLTLAIYRISPVILTYAEGCGAFFERYQQALAKQVPGLEVICQAIRVEGQSEDGWELRVVSYPESMSLQTALAWTMAGVAPNQLVHFEFPLEFPTQP
ncbi:MAG TPA: hypothetical protein PK299_07605 [Anaerolineales bacterium]|nr:hypothetical protein [Anaerolineales bacterium]